MEALLEFLNARVSEDERIARKALAATPQEWKLHELEHPAAVAPERMLAEATAKRGILDAAAFAPDEQRPAAPSLMDLLDRDDTWTDAVMEVVLAHLAEVYSAHPAYREEWRLWQ